PEDIKKKLTAHTKMDIKGVAWLALGILASMFAATYLGDKGSKALSFIFIGLVLVAAIGLIGFFKHIKLVKNPFIFPKFICGKGFGAVNFLNIFYGGTTQGVIALLPLYAAHRYGLNALDSGTLLIAQGSASVILSILTTIFLRRTGYKIPLYIGCSIILSGVALLAFQPLWGISPYYWLAIGAFLIGIGMGIISPPARNAGLQLAPEESATIAALRSLCLQLGSIISIAVFTAIIAGTELAGEAQASVYLVVAIVFLIFLPVISKVPEHKGSW
ncbi:MAG TPA: MFS transporter, partial [Flavobacteriaceae bacterium]|nr:MFS transporter [Flavobacteriaceae bacterium]